MRRFASLLLWIAAGACAETSDGDGVTAEAIDCAVDGSASFAPVCTVERQSGEEETLLILRHPSGGFRRLVVTGDGRGVAAADGAEQAMVTPLGERRIEVSLGGDRYRLPATVRAGAGGGG